LLAEFPNDHEEVRVVEIDKARSENVRRWWPFFRDRRIDAFGGLTERFLI
jgi:N-carbamoylputrescine amidase